MSDEHIMLTVERYTELSDFHHKQGIELIELRQSLTAATTRADEAEAARDAEKKDHSETLSWLVGAQADVVRAKSERDAARELLSAAEAERERARVENAALRGLLRQAMTYDNPHNDEVFVATVDAALSDRGTGTAAAGGGGE